MTKKGRVCAESKTGWEKTTKVFALPGAMIALVLAVIQLVGWFKGSETILFPPRQILFMAYQYPGEANEYLRLSSRMAYVNNGYAGYNSIIAQEKVRFSIAGKTYEQTGQSYETFRYKDGQLVSDYHSDAKPLPVIAGSSESHETFFAPQPVVCEIADQVIECQPNQHYIEWGRFIKIAGEAGQIEFSLTGELHDEDNVSETCLVKIDSNGVRNMVFRGYISLTCVNN